MSALKVVALVSCSISSSSGFLLMFKMSLTLIPVLMALALFASSLVPGVLTDLAS